MRRLRLAGPSQVDAAVATKYTVPTGMRACILHVHIMNPSLLPVTITMSVGADAAGARLYDNYIVPARTDPVTGGVIDHYWEVTLEDAEIVQTSSDTNDVLVLTLGGEEWRIE